ncbi:MAG: hypothetical protein Q9228_006273 [Teloschistes exilis]
MVGVQPLPNRYSQPERKFPRQGMERGEGKGEGRSVVMGIVGRRGGLTKRWLGLTFPAAMTNKVEGGRAARTSLSGEDVYAGEVVAPGDSWLTPNPCLELVRMGGIVVNVDSVVVSRWSSHSKRGSEGDHKAAESVNEKHDGKRARDERTSTAG